MTSSVKSSFDERVIRIADEGAILTLDYAGARAMHEGDSWWGLAVGFRAMQVAADILSQTKLWDRAELNVASGHPGPGVRDAIDYVTGCVARKRFSLFDLAPGARGCNRHMKFEWRLSDGGMTVAISLRPDFVPGRFYDLLDRLGTDGERTGDRSQFDALKGDLEARIWSEPLATSFHTECSPVV